MITVRCAVRVADTAASGMLTVGHAAEVIVIMPVTRGRVAAPTCPTVIMPVTGG
jgi:hypothetical protein